MIKSQNIYGEIWRQMELKKMFIAQQLADEFTEDTFNWRPVKCEEFTLPEFVIPFNRQQKKTREYLAKALAFIDLNKYRRYAEGCTIMPIPQTNKRLISICGSQQNCSNFLKYLAQIGLIEVHNNTCSWGHKEKEGKRTNYSFTYKYFYDNEVKIKNYCAEHDINKYHVIRHLAKKKVKISNFDDSQVKFSSDLFLLKPENYSKKKFEEYLEACLLENYPQLQDYYDLADAIDDMFYQDYPNLEVSFEPNFTWRGDAVVKIGIRATNYEVAAKDETKNHISSSDFKGKYRKDILNKYGLNLHYDVKSSVPRVTASLNNGFWVKDGDFYRAVSDVISLSCSDTDTLVKNFEPYRNALKHLHLRAYFDNGSERELGNHTCFAMYEVEDREEVYEAMSIYRNAIEVVEGSRFGSEIFLHESCIYMDVLKQLLVDGYFVWQVYDSWYAKKDGVTQEDFEQYVENLVEIKANEYIDKYF